MLTFIPFLRQRLQNEDIRNRFEILTNIDTTHEIITEIADKCRQNSKGQISQNDMETSVGTTKYTGIHSGKWTEQLT
jgi:hypothetical protein